MGSPSIDSEGVPLRGPRGCKKIHFQQRSERRVTGSKSAGYLVIIAIVVILECAFIVSANDSSKVSSSSSPIPGKNGGSDTNPVGGGGLHNSSQSQRLSQISKMYNCIDNPFWSVTRFG